MYAASLRVLGSGPRTPWAYLHSRGFTDETIERYRLGYCPGRGRNVLLEAVRRSAFRSRWRVRCGCSTRRTAIA
jgi:DNA primase